MRLTLALWAALAAMPAAAATDDQVAAVALPEVQLRGMLSRTLFQTQTMPMAAYNLGLTEFCAATRPAFEASVSRHLPTWRANLIRAYRDNVPANELDKAAAEGPLAGAPMVLPYLARIGAQMQAASKPVLEKAAQEVMLPVWKRASSIKRDTIDDQKRMAELRAAQADGSLFCGLMPVPTEAK